MRDHYETRDFNIGDLESIPNDVGGPRPGAGKCIARFFTREMKDDAKSTARGHYVPRMVEMVSIIVPGDKNSIPERKVRPQDKVDYPRQYAAFKKQEEFIPDGTPIETWPMVSRTQVYELKAANIFTVEAIAELSDEQLPVLGLGARNLRKHAQGFLSASAKGAPSSSLIAEMEVLKGQNMALTKQLADLVSKYEVLASKAGEKTTELSNPVTELRDQLQKTMGVADPTIVIPENISKLGIVELRKICKQLTDAPITSKEDALDLLNEYQAKKALVAA